MKCYAGDDSPVIGQCRRDLRFYCENHQSEISSSKSGNKVCCSDCARKFDKRANRVKSIFVICAVIFVLAFLASTMNLYQISIPLTGIAILAFSLASGTERISVETSRESCGDL